MNGLIRTIQKESSAHTPTNSDKGEFRLESHPRSFGTLPYTQLEGQLAAASRFRLDSCKIVRQMFS